MDFQASFVPVDDGSLPGDLEAQQALLKEWSEFNLESYYEHLSEFTYETTFIPIASASSFLRYLSKDEVDESIEDLIAKLESFFVQSKEPVFPKV
jgi:hypothetical protein